MMIRTLALCVVFLPAIAHANLHIVTTIKPVHAWVAAVTEGTDAHITLLVDGNASAHTYALKPSQAQALHRADVVVYISPLLERFLEKPLAALPNTTQVIALAQTPHLTLLPVRTGAAWVKHTHEEHDDHEEHDHHEEHEGADSHDHSPAHTPISTADMHVWLSPDNATLMVNAIANALAAKDAEHASLYQSNAQRYTRQIDDTARTLKTTLQPLAHKQFIVMHDAYQYFERAFGVHVVGSVMIRPEEPLAVRHVANIRNHMEQGHVACIFSEPQFDTAALQHLVQHTPTKQGVLDPLGATIPAGKGHYLALLTALAASFAQCDGKVL